MHKCTHIHTRTYIYTHMHASLHACIRTYIHTYVQICMHARIRALINIILSLYTCTLYYIICMPTHIYTYSYGYIHTYIHAYPGSQGADVVCSAAQAFQVSRPRLTTPDIGDRIQTWLGLLEHVRVHAVHVGLGGASHQRQEMINATKYEATFCRLAASITYTSTPNPNS